MWKCDVCFPFALTFPSFEHPHQNAELDVPRGSELKNDERHVQHGTHSNEDGSRAAERIAYGLEHGPQDGIYDVGNKMDALNKN